MLYKYQTVLQHGEADCGAACLAAIAKHYRCNLSLNRVREAVGTGQLGTTLLGLRRGAEALGFNARSARASSEFLDKLDSAPLPAIIHWKGYHWVVLYGKQGKKYVIADPAVGVRFLSSSELIKGWTDGILLLLEPDPQRLFAQPEEQVSGFRRFLKRVLPYRAILAEVLLINFVLGILSLAFPFLIQILTDDVLVRGDRDLLVNVAIAVVVMHLVSSILGFVQSHLISQFAQRLELGLVLEFAQKFLRLPLNYYESRRSGEIISRLRDIQQINQLVSQIVIRLPSQVFIAAISLIFMLLYSWKLSLIATLVAIVMSLSTIILLPTLQQKIRSVLVLDAENQGLLVETFKGAITFKTTTAEPQIWEEFQSRFGRFANLVFSTIHIDIINSQISGLVGAIGGVVLLGFGSNLVINKELSIGQLLAFNSMNGNFLALISLLVAFIDEFTRVQTAVQRVNEVIDATAETENDLKKPLAEISSNADIICTDVNFHHPGRVELLQNFSLTLPGGKVTALIGKSGCGKSTLAKLIAGLYPLGSGNIRFGIYNLQDLSLSCLRHQIVLVPQEAHFWSRSIIENFQLGSPQVSFEQIVKACQIAEADEFISKLPDKYQTVLGEFGANISGGQRQRLAIARAIVNEPPILILDESTANLDPVSEAELLEQLLTHRQGKTTIIISHRPRVITRADWIIYLDQGKLKLQGSLEELRSLAGDHLNFLTP